MSSEETPTTETSLPALAADPAHQERESREHQPAAFSRETILQKLAMLPGLVATGLLAPAKANSMRAVYDTMLRTLDGAAAAGRSITDGDALVLLRRQPELLRLVEPFLSPAQVELIVREAGDDD